MFGRFERHHRLEEQELRLRLAGHPHDHVVRLVRQRLRAALRLRDRPQVVALEEAQRVADVVAPEDPGLDVEQLLGDPQVRSQVVGQGRQRLEHRREDAARTPG